MATDENLEERQFVCSSCFQIIPESLIHILPHFNDDLPGYVTSYRCERCWLPSLEETRRRLIKTEDWTEISSLIDCFERHGVFLLEFRRGDPLPLVRASLARMIELLRSGSIRLSAGPLGPASEADALVLEIKMAEKRAEAAYDAMYEASPATAKDCFDDARGFLADAIELAKRARLEEEAARLTARRDHIVSVYDSQFRGIR